MKNIILFLSKLEKKNTEEREGNGNQNYTPNVDVS